MLFASVAFFAFLGRAQIASSHEARVAETAGMMARSGWPWSARAVEVPRVELERGTTGSRLIASRNGATISVNPWLVPVFKGQVRLQKPPLPYWFTAIAFRCFGKSAATARFVPAMLGVLSCGLIYVLGRRCGGRRMALIAVATWTSLHFVIDEHRKAMADPYLAFLSLAAIAAWIEASSRTRRRRALVLLCYILLAAGALAKGPIVFLHVGIAAAAFTWCFRRRPHAPLLWHLGGVGLFAAISLPWPIYILLHEPDALEIWRFESIGEFFDNQRNARPVWFYLPQLFLITAPWTAFGIAGIAMAVRRQAKAFPMVWAMALLLIFSASHMKKNAYLLPFMPALVILIAGGVNWMIAIGRRRPGSDRLWMQGHTIAGIVFAIATAIASARAGLPAMTTALISTFALLVASVPLWFSIRRGPMKWFRTQAVAFALVIAMFISFPQAARQNRRAVLDDPPAKEPATEPYATSIRP